ncbi:snx12, partial [Symbiodinium sp. KB8]
MASEAAGAPVPRAVDSSAIATSPNHLSSCAISSCVTRYEDEEKKKGKFTAFVIEIKTHGGLSWTVERRYRQFYNLNKELKQSYAQLKLFKFPQKKWFANFATSTIETRRRDFEDYLGEL